MFNKISFFNIKSDKNNSWNEVFVAQPDALKESLAGKVFILAEFLGKKNDGEKIFNFLISAIEENYYNDEKLLLKEKVEGLKTENIFEAALAKTNLELATFLEEEKINLNTQHCNLTIGIVFENHIHFSNFGKNRALLLYFQKNNYEVINVETNAFEKENLKTETTDLKNLKKVKIFSSVISGEMPKNSFFIFSSESLPEYISEKELSLIISKLPPLTAAFQIKSLLEKINSHVPFFGVIIKSASELDVRDLKEENKEPINAHSSISSLKNTEKKTEEMLATGSIINLNKLSNKVKEVFNFTRAVSKENLKVVNHLPKRIETREREDNDEITIQEMERIEIVEKIEIKPEEIENKTTKEKPEKNKLQDDFGIIRTLGAVKQDSNILKEKFSFKKSLKNPLTKIRITGSLLNLLDNIKRKLSSLNQKNKVIAIMIPLIIIILIVSIYSTKQRNYRQALEENFNRISTEINRQESMIEAKMLYDDRAGALDILNNINSLMAELPKETKEQQEKYNSLELAVKGIQDKIYRLNYLSDGEKIYDFSNTEINKLIFAADTLFAVDNKSIYQLDGSNNPEKIEIGDNINYYEPSTMDNNLFFFNNKELITLNLKDKKITKANISGYENENGVVSFKTFSNNIYLLTPEKNQVQMHRKSGTNYGSSNNWLKEDNNLSLTQDLYIDGSIYILNNDASVNKYYTGSKQEYNSKALEPLSSGFNKIVGSSNKLYLLNPSEKRLAIIDKASGALLNQYIFNGINNLLDLAVDEKNNLIYLLDENTVVKFKL